MQGVALDVDINLPFGLEAAGQLLFAELVQWLELFKCRRDFALSEKRLLERSFQRLHHFQVRIGQPLWNGRLQDVSLVQIAGVLQQSLQTLCWGHGRGLGGVLKCFD
ncbi:hypothetical protein D3C84_954250 [compost metagenome]